MSFKKRKYVKQELESHAVQILLDSGLISVIDQKHPEGSEHFWKKLLKFGEFPGIKP